MPKNRQILCVVVTGILFSIFISSTSAYASSIGEEYQSDGDFVVGTIVSSSKERPGKLLPATLLNEGYLLGVVQRSGDSLLTISKVYSNTTVAISGQVNVLASNVNGPIKKGDFVGASWIEGVGMNFDQAYGKHILGIALEDFTDKNSKTYDNINTPDGIKSAEVSYLSLKLAEGQQYAASATTSGPTSFIQSLSGKNVSSFRVIFGSLIFFASLTVAGIFIYSAIKSSFIAFGRNPMASSSIYGGLVQISGLSVGIVLLGSVVAYIIWVL